MNENERDRDRERMAAPAVDAAAPTVATAEPAGSRRRVEMLFPEFCNIYGESYNVEYLRRCNSCIQVLYTSHRETPAFVKGPVDMVYLGCTTERKQEQIIELLRPHRARIEALIEAGTIFLVTGNAVEIFGNYIQDAERRIEALGIFDFYAERYMRRDRHNSQYIGTFEDLTMLGHRSQFSFAYGDFREPFIQIQKGIGMNPDTKLEGLRRRNFYGTYSLGPYLIMNPLFTKRLLRLMGLSDSLCFEKEAVEAYEYRLAELTRTMP